MSFDYSKVLSQIKNTTPSESNKVEYKYKLVYPGEGNLNVRLLYNPKSGLVTRLINRHTIGNTKMPCMATYTSKDDCPICKVINQAESAGIKMSYSVKSKVRAIMFAQYHSSSYEIDGVKKGDIILLMVPWSVYKDINKFMSDVSADPESMERAFGEPEYFAITIEHGSGNQDWSARLSPVIVVKSADSREEFEAMLEGLDSLYEAINGIHETPTEDDIKIMTEAADQLRESFYQQTTEAAPSAPVSANQEPETAKSAFSDANAPACFGKDFVPMDSTDSSKLIQKIKCKNCEFNEACKESVK